jgi:predicted Zn-dependent peptidase
MRGMQSAALGIWIKAGGRYEDTAQKGISHYLEHMLFKGARHYSCSRIKESIEGVGGALNGFTSEEFTCYLVKLPARHLSIALDILSDMVLDPLLKADDFAKEKTVILEEIKMYKDQPQGHVHDLLDGLLWPGHPLGEPIVGSEESVGNLSRQDLLSYHKRYYTPENIVVSSSGSVEHEWLTRQVKAKFLSLQDRRLNSFIKAGERQARPQLKILAKDTEQSHLALGFHGLKRDHPRRYALALLNIILGGNMSSRLFNEVREKRGLAYEIGSQVKRFADTGAILVHAGMDNQKVGAAIRLILKELYETKSRLVTSGELARAKEFYLGQLELMLEDTLDQMLWIGESTAAMDKVYSLEEIIKGIRKVTRQDLKKVAGDILLKEKLNVALIGPLQEQEETLRKILEAG